MLNFNFRQWTGITWLKAILMVVFLICTAQALFGDLSARYFLTTLSLLVCTGGLTICFTQREAKNWYTKAYSHVGMALWLCCFVLSAAAINNMLARVWDNRILGIAYFASAAAAYCLFRHFALKKSWGYFSQQNWRYEALFVVLNAAAVILTWVTYHKMPSQMWGSIFIQLVALAVAHLLIVIFCLQFNNEENQARKPMRAKVARIASWVLRATSVLIAVTILNQSFDWVKHEFTRTIAVIVIGGFASVSCYQATRKKHHPIIRSLSGVGVLCAVISSLFLFGLVWDIQWIESLINQTGEHILSILIYAIASSAASVLYFINKESHARAAASGFAYLFAAVFIFHVSSEQLPGRVALSLMVIGILGYSIFSLWLLLSKQKNISMVLISLKNEGNIGCANSYAFYNGGHRLGKIYYFDNELFCTRPYVDIEKQQRTEFFIEVAMSNMPDPQKMTQDFLKALNNASIVLTKSEVYGECGVFDREMTLSNNVSSTPYDKEFTDNSYRHDVFEFLLRHNIVSKKTDGESGYLICSDSTVIDVLKSLS